VEHDSPTATRGAAVRDLAPTIHRQRLVIEGYPDRAIAAEEIADYLQQLSASIDMRTILEPVTHRSDRFGWAGWIHWETSGAHFYAWEDPLLFFSVDIYTCKAFDASRAVDLTEKYFESSDIEWWEF
jgi:hypothetical protein